jgi:hypothetical protein
MVYYTVIMHLKESNLLTPQLRLIDVAYLILYKYLWCEFYMYC